MKYACRIEVKPLVELKDLIIIRAGLYIRHAFNEKKKDVVGRTKSEIGKKYGKRGSNIVNLTTAGYLEDRFIPLYEYLKENENCEDDAKKKFVKIFNRISDELPFTIFVCQKMTVVNVYEEVEKRVKYGVKKINIHGIGKNNVKNINMTIHKLEENGMDFRKEIKEEHNIIFAVIEFLDKV